MKNIQIPVYGTTIMLCIYSMTPVLGFTWAVVFNLFLIMNFLLIWMVIRVLKDGVASTATFEEKWYDDQPSHIQKGR